MPVSAPLLPSLSDLLKHPARLTVVPGFVANHAPINYAIRTWNLYDAAAAAHGTEML